MFVRLNLLDVLGRLLAGSLFLGSGYDHITNWARSVALIAGRGLPAPGLCLGMAVMVESVGAIGLMLGWHTRVAACALAAFSIVASSLFHANFAVEAEAHMFAKDLALAGALLCLASRPPGAYSLDVRRSC
jgi:putative oxidoreductase